MASGNAQTATGIFTAWEKRDFDGLTAPMSEDVVVEDKPRGETIKGRDGARGWFASWADACPDSVVNTRVVGESEDTVVLEGLWEGTNTGPFGPVPATGKAVTLPFVNIMWFDGDGNVTRATAYYDQLSLLTQLGLVEPPG